jgi:hypothetical protein
VQHIEKALFSEMPQSFLARFVVLRLPLAAAAEYAVGRWHAG